MALEAASGLLYQQKQQQQENYLFGLNNGGSNTSKDVLYPLLLETTLSSACYDTTFLSPPNCFSQFNPSTTTYGFDLDLLNDCCYGLINNNHNNDCVWDNHYHNYSSASLSPPPDLVGINNVPTTTTDNDNQQGTWGGQNSSSSAEGGGEYYAAAAVVSRPKRRRARARKNKEDIENQRMTHIAVERNRRKQMNDYLAVLRSLMPDSYVQRGDQASIVGGAINFVKELEQRLQCLSAKKQIQANLESGGSGSSTGNSSILFGEFFTFPQYSTGSGGADASSTEGGDHEMKAEVMSSQQGGAGDGGGGGGALAADVEVTMVESHALVKIRSKRPPKQLSKVVMGLQGLRLTILHLNVTKVDGVALYSFSVKVEDESKLSSADEIAGAVNQLLGRIQEEANLNC